MYGLEAINANNGWAISVVGITIVFSGLVMLSLVISQLYKVVDLIDDPGKIKKWFTPAAKAKDKETAKTGQASALVVTEAQKETARQFALLVRTMEDHFSLVRLLHLSRISGLADPHTNLSLLLKSGIITPDGQGYFTWDQDLFSKTMS